MTTNRRKFIKDSLLFGLSNIALTRTLEQLTGQEVFQSAMANAATASDLKRYVFIFLDGGIRWYDFLDPLGQPSHPASSAPGLNLVPISGYESEACVAFSVMEKAGKYGDFIQDGKAPVLRQRVDGVDFDLGASAGAFNRLLSDARFFRGVETSIEHGTASQLAWCGQPFGSEPRPTIDCLLAGLTYSLASQATKDKMLFPHLIMGRSGYVPASIPQLVAQFPVPPGKNGEDFRRFFGSFLDASFAYGSAKNEPLRAAIHEFVNTRNSKFQAAVQHKANVAFLEEMDRIEDSRRKLYSNSVLDSLKDGVNSYLTGPYKSTPTGEDIAGLTKHNTTNIETLQAQLALVRHCLKEGLTSVATVNLGNTTFDCHGGYGPSVGWASYRQISFALEAFVRALRSDGLLGSTTVVLFSEMGRDPYFGLNHHAWGTWAIIGGRIGQSTGAPRLFGGTEANFDASQVDPSTGAIMPLGSGKGQAITPKDILALLMEDAGLPSGTREMETLFRITQAPAYLRKLIT